MNLPATPAQKLGRLFDAIILLIFLLQAWIEWRFR